LASHHHLSVAVLATVNGVKGSAGHVTLRAAVVKHKKKH